MNATSVTGEREGLRQVPSVESRLRDEGELVKDLSVDARLLVGTGEGDVQLGVSVVLVDVGLCRGDDLNDLLDAAKRKKEG